jgi:replicative DNA helicase
MRDDELLLHVPPHSLESEREVLGASLIFAEAAVEVAAFLRPGDFYRPVHAVIFSAIRELLDRREPIDTTTVLEELRRRGSEDVGRDELGVLAGVSGANAAYHARIVHGKARLRAMLEALGDSKRRILESRERPEELLEEIEQRIFAAADARTTKEPRPVGEILVEVFEDLARGPESTGAVSSGFPDLDDFLGGGFAPGEFVIVAGRPSTGKSTVLLNMTRRLVLGTPARGAVVFSLEMRDRQLVKNALASIAGVDSQKIRRRCVSPTEQERLLEAGERLDATPFLVDYCPRATLLEVRAKARRLRAKGAIDVVFLDYLGLMRGEDAGGRKPRHEVIGEISNGLKVLAGELELPVVVAAQVNRDADGERPTLAMLRDSGSLEQDADVVIFLHHEKDDPPSVVTLIVAKNRDGRTGDVRLRHDADICLFRPFEEHGAPTNERKESR